MCAPSPCCGQDITERVGGGGARYEVTRPARLLLQARQGQRQCFPRFGVFEGSNFWEELQRLDLGRQEKKNKKRKRRRRRRVIKKRGVLGGSC